MGRGGAGAAAAAFTLWWLTRCAGAVWLELSTTATKCLSEEIQSNVVVMADYSILFEEHPVRPTVSAKVQRVAENRSSTEKKKENRLRFFPDWTVLQVTSPYGDILHHAEKVSHGQFAFTTAESGIYLACFWAGTLEKGMVINLNLDWRIGIAAKDWDSIAKKEKIDVSTVVARNLGLAI
jgi:p24 family protein delta-1